MVLYFSGTGNSKYAAQMIAETTSDTILSMNQFIKQGSKREFISDNKPFVFVCPTYAWRIPRIIEEFIRNSSFIGNHKVYFIMTCGDDTENALGYIKKLCKSKSFELQGFAEVIMPENYIAMFPTPDKLLADEIIQKSTIDIIQIAEKIRDGLTLDTFTPKSKFKSTFINGPFYKIIVKSKGFHTTDKCIGCKKCVQLCPLNNIKMQEGKPSWDNQCTHCMACICGCPISAIEYKNKTQGKHRYYLTIKNSMIM